MNRINGTESTDNITHVEYGINDDTRFSFPLGLVSRLRISTHRERILKRSASDFSITWLCSPMFVTFTLFLLQAGKVLYQSYLEVHQLDCWIHPPSLEKTTADIPTEIWCMIVKFMKFTKWAKQNQHCLFSPVFDKKTLYMAEKTRWFIWNAYLSSE